MDIRRQRLDDHVEYFLDGASEANEIDACTATTLRLYGDAATLRAIIAVNHPGKDWRERLRTGIDLANYANSILPRLPTERRGALIYSGIASMSYMVTSLAKVLADWAATDETEGGAMKPFLRKRARLHRDGSIFRNTARRIHSTSWIRRYIKQSESCEARHLRVVTRIAFERMAMVPHDAILYGGSALTADLNLQQQWQRQDYVATHTAGRSTDNAAQRKLLKRAAIFAASLIGTSMVSALARGEPILIAGPTIALQIQKKTSLVAIGHGNLSVAVTDHAGLPLADLCIYFEKTPAIDQVAGLALWMKAGLESEIIGRANITGISKEGIAHPLFVERRKQNDNQYLVDTLMRSPWHGSMWKTHRQRMDEYWRATGHIWTEALAVFVLGAPAAKVYRSTTPGAMRLEN